VGKRDFKSNITTHLFPAGTTKILLLHIFRPNFWKQTCTCDTVKDVSRRTFVIQ